MSAGWLGLIKPLIYYIWEEDNLAARLKANKTHVKGPSASVSPEPPRARGRVGWGVVVTPGGTLSNPTQGVPGLPAPPLAFLQLPRWVGGCPGDRRHGGPKQPRKGHGRAVDCSSSGHWGTRLHQDTSPGERTPMGHGRPAPACPCQRAGLSPGSTRAWGSRGVQGQCDPMPSPAAGKKPCSPKSSPYGPFESAHTQAAVLVGFQLFASRFQMSWLLKQHLNITAAGL